jgi:D-alanyl-D-alanine carboxypeptidase
MSDNVAHGAARRLRWIAFGLAVVAVAVATADPADAKHRRKRVAPSYNPPYASIVVDANSGAVLQASNPDSLRHPASLTKIMTLYLLFERLENGRLKLTSPLPVSAHASVQAPTKLGLRPGQSIEVEDAILALVTKSANDAAVVIAEAIGGSEPEFARMMTRKARALGMRRTTYLNASGLPDSDQVTTARDQATLGRAIQERFPRYYHYFSTAAFEFHGRTIANHNRLLGRVEGVDGIKTGYTRDSGFNLVTSMHRGRRHVVAVVLGGRSAGSRDARMRDLLAEHIQSASTRGTASVLAEAESESKAERIAANEVPAPIPPTRQRVAATEATASIQPPIQLLMATTVPNAGSTEPIKPRPVKTVSIKPTPKSAATKVAAVAPAPQAEGDIEEARPSKITALLERKVGRAAAHKPAPHKARSGWMIQVGAFDAEGEARTRLSSAKQRAKKLLGDADPFTEPVTKGEKTFYRARFAGLYKNQAEAACRTLKRSDMACMALRN